MNTLHDPFDNDVASTETSETDERPRDTLLEAPRQVRVLVAEDDQDLRELITGVLDLDGLSITEAANGTEMFKMLSQASVDSYPEDAFDLIITDVRMPDCTGLYVIEQLRGVGCRTPVIAITSFPTENVREEAERLDTLLLPKPFTLRALRTAVSFYLTLSGRNPQGRVTPR